LFDVFEDLSSVGAARAGACAASAERAGHSVRLIDLQCESHPHFFRSVDHHTEQFVNATRMGTAA